MYLVVGANGYLGAYFLKNILTRYDGNILATTRNIERISITDERISWLRLDVEDFGQVDSLAERLEKTGESLKVIYLAAYHHPDMVEKHPHKAWNVNVTALSYFLNRVGNVDYFVYPSTDTVYGEGSLDKPFAEASPLRPANRYGRHKIVAETLVQAYGYHVVRYPFLISPSLLQYKEHFYDMIVDKITAGQPVEMFKDSYRSSLDFDTVACLTLRLMDLGNEAVPSVVNVSGDKALSKYDIGLMIADRYHVDRSLIKPVSMQEKNEIFTVPRAAATILDNSLLKKLLGLDKVEIHIA